MTEEKTSTMDSIRELISSKFDSGFEILDNKSSIELNKLVRDELKLKKDWHGKTKKAIGDEMKKRNISLIGKGFQSETKWTIQKKEDPIPPEVKQVVEQDSRTKEAFEIGKQIGESNQSSAVRGALPMGTPQTTKSPFGTLPIPDSSNQQNNSENQNQINQPQKKMSATAQERLITNTLTKFIPKIYVALGAIKPSKKEQKEIEKETEYETFLGDVKGFSKELNDYLIENDIKLPQFLNHVAILFSFAIVFVIPLVKLKMVSNSDSPDNDYDKDAEDIRIDV